MAKTSVSLRDLESKVGQEVGVSPWVEIAQQRIDEFAKATEDFQWIHVDPARAKNSPFGGTIAHGHLTLSLAPFFFGQIIEVKGVRMIVNPGIEHMRLRAPVRSGDRVRMHATLKDLRDLPGGALRATLTLQFEIEGQSRPAAFGDAALVYYPDS